METANQVQGQIADLSPFLCRQLWWWPLGTVYHIAHCSHQLPHKMVRLKKILGAQFWCPRPWTAQWWLSSFSHINTFGLFLSLGMLFSLWNYGVGGLHSKRPVVSWERYWKTGSVSANIFKDSSTQHLIASAMNWMYLNRSKCCTVFETHKSQKMGGRMQGRRHVPWSGFSCPQGLPSQIWVSNSNFETSPSVKEYHHGGGALQLHTHRLRWRGCP